MNKSHLQKTFGTLVRKRRLAAGVSQEAIAEKAGIHSTYLSLLERGERAPTIEVLRRLALAFDTSMTALVAELEGVEVTPKQTRPPRGSAKT